MYWGRKSDTIHMGKVGGGGEGIARSYLGIMIEFWHTKGQPFFLYVVDQIKAIPSKSFHSVLTSKESLPCEKFSVFIE